MTFTEALQQQQRLYPLMRPQDYAKLAWQSTFGPEPPARDSGSPGGSVLPELRNEWLRIPEDTEPHPVEDISGRFSRFFLTGEYPPLDTAPLLARLVQRTAEQARGTQAEFREKLELLQGLNASAGDAGTARDLPPDLSPVEGMSMWLRRYRNNEKRPITHSAIYQRNYHPHYRVIASPHALFFPLLLRIMKLSENRTAPLFIAIDGRCGSGKTELSALLAHLFPCNVFHMDDFIRPEETRSKDWKTNPLGVVDLSRFQKEVLEPAQAGRPVVYRPYDSRMQSFRSGIQAPARPVNVIDGVYCLHPSLGDPYTLRVFLTCSDETQAVRLSRREGDRYPDFLSIWLPLEEQYFLNCSTADTADFCFETDSLD